MKYTFGKELEYWSGHKKFNNKKTSNPDKKWSKEKNIFRGRNTIGQQTHGKMYRITRPKGNADESRRFHSGLLE